MNTGCWVVIEVKSTGTHTEAGHGELRNTLDQFWVVCDLNQLSQLVVGFQSCQETTELVVVTGIRKTLQQTMYIHVTGIKKVLQQTMYIHVTGIKKTLQQTMYIHVTGIKKTLQHTLYIHDSLYARSHAVIDWNNLMFSGCFLCKR